MNDASGAGVVSAPRRRGRPTSPPGRGRRLQMRTDDERRAGNICFTLLRLRLFRSSANSHSGRTAGGQAKSRRKTNNSKKKNNKLILFVRHDLTGSRGTFSYFLYLFIFWLVGAVCASRVCSRCTGVVVVIRRSCFFIFSTFF